MTTPGEPNSQPLSLSYESPPTREDLEGDNLVMLAQYADTNEAAVRVNALEAAGIDAVAVNQHANNLGIHMSGLAPVEIQVRKRDRDAAAEVLRLATSDEVEPAPDQPDTLPPLESGGEPVALVEAARFDSIRPLREAVVSLESVHIRAVPPRIVARTPENAGSGRRFVLKVSAADIDRATEVLEDVEEEFDEDDLRCPKCASWRVYPVGQLGATVKWILRLGDKPTPQMDCLQCKYRGAKREFERGSIS